MSGEVAGHAPVAPATLSFEVVLVGTVAEDGTYNPALINLGPLAASVSLSPGGCRSLVSVDTPAA
jgi:hypothetical protein